ncbi:MAG: hypothetical protein JNM30_09250 [Rhodospirillales bacterium]|nr:hypothetical protein [Rhodospirillales bacterium]
MSDLDLTPAFGHPLRRPASWRGARNPRYDLAHAADPSQGHAPHAPVFPLAIVALAAIAGLAAWLLSNTSPV